MNAPESANLSPSTSMAQWQASLKMMFDQFDGVTRPVLREHFGPLRALRGFSAPPGHNDLFEQIIVHPPGGIARGDQLSINIDAGERTHTLFTAPGAAKWYRSANSLAIQPASQQIAIHAARHATVEWLPMENIVFNTAQATLKTTVELDSMASFIGADMVCLGRPANNETFDAGLLQSRTLIQRESRPIFNEQLSIRGGDPVLQARAGLAGASCFANLLVVPPAPDADALQTLTEHIRLSLQAYEEDQLAVTALDELITVRWFGPHAERGWQALRAAWRCCREQINGRTGADPRIWQC